ncbi:hypothetical protein AQPE_1119 [Aquipluma nitroreducens]|uniref:Uncharacterized protein n=1 Tax=Aquipluma nitroreducens TaxID=2010828 RepID=A0A5K7S620_9BACT|nr:hypothetical protein AQPE_1119 [Aquipluma nitroreducens]
MAKLQLSNRHSMKSVSDKMLFEKSQLIKVQLSNSVFDIRSPE